jgi:hypothetical protein
MRSTRCAIEILAFALFAGFACVPCPGEAGGGRRAMLVSGADSVRGLPFFSPNAIAALTGVYSSDAAAAVSATSRITLWYTREAVVLGSAWKRLDLGGSAAYSLARDSGSALCLKGARYALFFVLPVDDAANRAFILAFNRKFLVFFENAPTDAELSFPAYVDY